MARLSSLEQAIAATEYQIKVEQATLARLVAQRPAVRIKVERNQGNVAISEAALDHNKANE